MVAGKMAFTVKAPPHFFGLYQENHQGGRTGLCTRVIKMLSPPAGKDQSLWATAWSTAVLLIDLNQNRQVKAELSHYLQLRGTRRNPLKDRWWNNNLSLFNLFHLLREKLHVTQCVILLYLFFQTSLKPRMTTSWNNPCVPVHTQSLDSWYTNSHQRVRANSSNHLHCVLNWALKSREWCVLHVCFL